MLDGAMNIGRALSRALLEQQSPAVRSMVTYMARCWADGYIPDQWEIAEACGFQAPSRVSKTMPALADAGWITWVSEPKPRSPRRYRLTEQTRALVGT